MQKYECIVRDENNKKKFDKDFIKIPSKIYCKDEIMQDKETELQILNDRHILSHYFITYAFITYSKHKPLCRCIITSYNNDDKAYLGFFETIYDFEAVKVMYESVEKMCKALDKKEIVGPVDSSFWIKYRMRIDSLNNPYSFEPFNRNFYYFMWQKLGFKICEKYYSSFKQVPNINEYDIKLKDRYDRYKNSDFNEIELTQENYDKYKKEFFKLFTKLYSTFPMYKEITFEEFDKLFSSMTKIINPELAKIVLKNNEIVAFMICIPNYGNLLYNKSLHNINKMMKIKKKCSEYIVLYSGASKDGFGVVPALAEEAKEYFANNKCTSIGALMHEGKITNSYYSSCDVSRTTYVLFSKNLD